MPSQKLVDFLLARFSGATQEMLDRIFTPYRLEIIQLSREGNQGGFVAQIPKDVWTIFEDGTTGKVVPREYVQGRAPWREIIKARITHSEATVATGELYFAAPRVRKALDEVAVGDFIEIDAFGVTSKVESALCEAAFFQVAEGHGFNVRRMPENVAKHIGTQNYYDFRLDRHGRTYRVELKSLWGTDTSKARLIHTVSRAGGGKNSARQDRQVWATSSCRFKDQDIFAVSMWLRTGRITDFAFALSVPESVNRKWGLPVVPKFPEHVTQNPDIADPPIDPWTTDLEVISKRFDSLKR